MDPTKFSWLRLFRSENVGPRTFDALIALYHSPEAALDVIPELSLKGGRKKPIQVASVRQTEEEVKKLEACGGKFIARYEPEYPALLRHISDPPPIISVLGDITHFKKPMLAIVGSRNASINGMHFAEQLATKMGMEGAVTVSGLARGIDAAAHRGSLKTGTIAVVAGGVDVVYPTENKGIYDKIVESGAVISEMPFGSTPRPEHFPRRNRIISGVSEATLVVEANPRSGSLITASMALEQGREVFAVPGSPLDARSLGTNRLIKDGATLVSSLDDVVNFYRNLPQNSAMNEAEGAEYGATPLGTAPVSEQLVLECRDWLVSALSITPTPFERVVADSPFAISALLAALVELELAGLVKREPGNRLVCIASALQKQEKTPR
jgi:DNA processing protein